MKAAKYFVAVSLLLTACGGIPTDGAIHRGESVASGDDQFIRVIARPPIENMTPEQIVRGFLDACADPTSTFSIARQYLTSQADDSWNPGTGIQVYDGNWLKLTGANGKVTLTAPKDSNVTANGHLSFSSKSSNVTSEFELIQDAAHQWRISSLGNGLLLARADFERSFRPFPLYFVNDDASALVPDSIVLPTSSAGTATSVTRSLLEGPSTDLRPAVDTAFPPGTKLTYNSVPINGGVAQVDLSPEVLAASKVERAKLSAQLVATLTSIQGVTGVRITVSGQPLKVPGVQGVQTMNDWKRFPVRFDPEHAASFFVRDSQVMRLDGNRAVTVSEMQMPSVSRLAAAGIAPSGGSVAATTVDGKSLLVSNLQSKPLRVIASGEAFTRPAWDHRGNILVPDNGRGLLAFTRDGNRVPLTVADTPIGTPNQIHQISVALDGTRIALVYRSGNVDSIAVGIIVHTDTEIMISQIHRVERSIVTVNDIVWATPTTLEVLGGRSATYQELLSVDTADGQTLVESAPIGSQSISVEATGNILVGVMDGTNETIVKQTFGPWEPVVAGRSPFTAYVTKVSTP